MENEIARASGAIHVAMCWPFITLCWQAVQLHSSTLPCATTCARLTWNRRRHGGLEYFEGQFGDLLGEGWLCALVACGDHVGLQQQALQVDAVVQERLEL